MSDLAKNLLTQYYGLGTGSNGKRFLSIHQSVENIKRDEEIQVIEQTSSTNEEKSSDEESQKDNNECRKLSVANNSYPPSSEVYDDIEDAYDFDENLDDFESNMDDFAENTQSSITNDQSSNAIKETVEDSEANDSKNTNENDMSLTFIEDAFPDSGSDTSTTLNKSEKSSRTDTNLPVPKKEPICNQTFVDFSGTELTQFPSEILIKFPYIRMLYVADNDLTELPADIFTSLRYLEWLDARNNSLSSLSATIKFHTCLETLLLQRNKIENLPLELCTLPKLKTLQVAQNPLITPPQDVVASGYSAILEFLRIEWNNAHPEERVEFKENKIEPKLSTILCYQSPRRNKKKIVPLKSAVRNRDPSTVEKRKSYKPSSRCENKGANISLEYRSLLFSKIKEWFDKQTLILQKVKDENVLKKWRRDKRSFSISMEKAMKRSEDDIPFGFDLEDYAPIFRHNLKSNNQRGSKIKRKQKFVPPTDINKKINELLKSLNELEVKDAHTTSPRTKQNLFKNEIEKILQFQNEIQNLRKYNDVATVPLKKLNKLQ
ncbi:plant intracellular Ras-group-related LRR protein 9-like [Osmia bicornis bicornis]|uniref:plant intracellular Ras-group-related LRR protein 9-like n=1 Tax=Osmia bicornis bicornis TaxID=1437191 RepID=UPI001EAF07C2|nr:plant intracellular Ras-group-related LRR protein 9-like [Osmia bicornis bicornis]